MDQREAAKQSVSGHREFRRRSDVEKVPLKPEEVLSEVELRVAIEATGLGIFDYSPINDELHWTHLAKEHFGLSPDAHVNYNVFLVGLHPDDRARVSKLVDGVLRHENDGKYKTEYRTVGIEDGKERWIAACGQVFFNQKGEAVRLIGTTRDITEHKRAEEQLLRTIQELKQALNDRQRTQKNLPGQE